MSDNFVAEAKEMLACKRVVVLNLANIRNVQVFVGIDPAEAVMAAYAQSRGDYTTWDYANRYGDRVQRGEITVGCGSFTAFRRHYLQSVVDGESDPHPYLWLVVARCRVSFLTDEELVEFDELTADEG